MRISNGEHSMVRDEFGSGLGLCYRVSAKLNFTIAD